MAYSASDLYDKVSVYLGYGRSTSLADSGQNADVVDALNEGLRTAYYPKPQGTPYVWSFLQPRGTITTVAGTSSYSVSGAVIGDLTWPNNAGNDRKIKLIGEFQLRNMMQNQNPSNGFPRYAALIPSTSGSYTIQTDCPFDAAYTITYAYRVVPSINGLSSSVYGGDQFSSVLTMAVLAAAEKMINNMPGVHSQTFDERLQAAIVTDMQLRPSSTGTYYDQMSIDAAPIGHMSVGIPTFLYNGVPQ